jgi:oxysterol-binding protein 1
VAGGVVSISDSSYYKIVDLPNERAVLPKMRDPNQKVSVWQILKDLIGKDLTKVSMPVYFNEPLSLTQKMAETCENNYLLDLAAKENDSQRRLAIIGTYMASRQSSVIGRM